MIFVHHLENSRSHRILWLLEELAVPYEMVIYERDKKTMLAPPELKKVHPLGKSPVITDGDLTIAESGAVLEYLVDTYGDGRFRPEAGTVDFLNYRYWMHYAEGSAMPLVVLKLIFTEVPKHAPWFVRPVVKAISKAVSAQVVDPQMEQNAAFWEKHLGANTYMAGDDFSAADIQMSYPVEAVVTRMRVKTSIPATTAYLQRLHDRPAYQRALQRGGAPLPG